MLLLCMDAMDDELALNLQNALVIALLNHLYHWHDDVC
jgi:hypothetical protein